MPNKKMHICRHFYRLCLVDLVIFWSVKKDIADCSIVIKGEVNIMQADCQQVVHELGDASFYLFDYHFCQNNENGICTLQPQRKQGEGTVYQVQPTEGMFLSTGNWIPYTKMERKYEINQKLIKIYYLESGDITLIQNGKKTQTITEGVHLYLNKPSQGRVLYQPNIPISYVSVLLFDDYIENNIQTRFTPDDFDYAEVYDWKVFDYNTPEIGALFLQIRNRLIARENSRLYYESKVGELLSIVATNFHKQRESMVLNNRIPIHEQKSLEAVRLAIEQNILNPPEIEHLCKISAMGKTKLRESFKVMYGVPIGTYIRQSKMKYATLLLKKDELSISSIAKHLGYQNASKFSSAFKNYFNQTPDSYRKNYNSHKY